jgi:methyltransferase (TIGR00027 family)
MAGDDAADLSGVGWTATGIAAIRALETARPDRLFKDPLAARFVAASGRSLANRQAAAGADERTRRHWSAIQQWVVVRTRFLDELVVRACREGCSQVIVLGAGLDARAFRLHWPAGVRLFEVDLPEVLAFKERVLASSDVESRCTRIVVPCDLRRDWPSALTAAGVRSEPMVWIAEGLLVYLTDEENDRLLSRVSSLSPLGSRLGLSLRRQDADAPASSSRELWQSDGVDHPGAWLAGHGWLAEVFDADERATAHGRPRSTVTGSRRHRRRS